MIVAVASRGSTQWDISKTEAFAPQAMVATDQPSATEAALEVLREGGNAVDAAVTATFVMGVAEPALGGLGGGAVMVMRLPDGRETVIDGSPIAPRAARPDMFSLETGSDVKGMYAWPATVRDENNLGYRSVGVPGMLAAMSLALERYGTIDLRRALRPAINLARHGVELDIEMMLTLNQYAERLWMFPASKRIYYKDGGLPFHPPTALEGGGERLQQPDLARSLELVGEKGVNAFYRGELASAIVEDVARNGGILTLDDLSSYHAREVSALVTQHGAHRVATVPECGGGITVVEMLNVLEALGVSRIDRDTPLYFHLIAEAQRRAFIDRFQQLGDPALVDAPYTRLASPEHARSVCSDIEGALAASVRIGGAAVDAPHTTHVCVVDPSRTCVSLTSTLGAAFGSAVVVEGTGILLSNVMTWFDPRPGRPASIAGGKRVLWAPAPTIVSRDGTPRLALGGAGGRRLISGVAQTLVNVIDHGDGPQAAVNGLRVHDEGAGTLVDARLPQPIQDALLRMGRTVVPTEDTLATEPFGRVNAILIEAEGLRGGVSRLRPSVAAGF